MKNLKLVLLGSLVAYLIFLIINFALKKETIYELTENENYEKTMLIVENKIENLSKKDMTESDKKCFDIAKSLKKHSLETYVKTSISDTELLKKQYESEDYLLTYYVNIVKECNLNEDEKILISNMGYSAIIMLESIYQDKLTNYKFEIEDTLIKNIQGTYIYEIGYKTSKLSEAFSLIKLLEVLEARYEENI